MANRYRFGIGTKVECDVGERDHVGGVIVAINYREDYWPEGQTVPYQVRLNDGRLIYAPQDDDRLIRKASNHVIHSLLQDMDEDGLRAQCKPMVALRMKEERAKQVQQLNAPSRIGEPPIVCLFKRERDVEWILTAAEILRNGGADMGAMDRQQTTFLHSAARKGQPALLDFCLKVLESAEEYDLDINAQDLQANEYTSGQWVVLQQDKRYLSGAEVKAMDATAPTVQARNDTVSQRLRAACIKRLIRIHRLRPIVANHW
jgi:hypothetical protein